MLEDPGRNNPDKDVAVQSMTSPTDIKLKFLTRVTSHEHAHIMNYEFLEHIVNLSQHMTNTASLWPWTPSVIRVILIWACVCDKSVQRVCVPQFVCVGDYVWWSAQEGSFFKKWGTTEAKRDMTECNRVNMRCRLCVCLKWMIIKGGRLCLFSWNQNLILLILLREVFCNFAEHFNIISVMCSHEHVNLVAPKWLKMHIIVKNSLNFTWT